MPFPHARPKTIGDLIFQLEIFDPQSPITCGHKPIILWIEGGKFFITAEEDKVYDSIHNVKSRDSEDKQS